MREGTSDRRRTEGVGTPEAEVPKFVPLFATETG